MNIFEINLLGITIAPSYYGLMYAIWIYIWYEVLLYKKLFKKEELENILIYVFLWIILWWRLWYVFFYNFEYYISNPSEIIKIWEWWMSFHWWVIWTMIWVFLYNKNLFLENISKIALVAPIWIFLWRIWNYLNKELLGFPYSWFLSVEKDWVYYFPSPLLEAFLEWIVLFLILNLVYYKTKKIRIIWPLFLIWYWVFRIFIEFFRTPDAQIWYIFWFLTLWQILSFVMILIWIFTYNFALKKK